MVSYGSSGIGVLLCVFWLSHDSLKVACDSRIRAASLISALGAKGGRAVGDRATEAEVKAMIAAIPKALDAGLGAGKRCVESLRKGGSDLVKLMKVPVEKIQKNLEKDAVDLIKDHPEQYGRQFCAVKKHLVCVEEKCTGCGDLTESQKSDKVVKEVCEVADEINGEGRKHLSPLLIGLSCCVYVGILHSLFFK